MHRTKLPLTVWFWAAHLMATHSNGMSARQLEDQLGLTYKTAWLLTKSGGDLWSIQSENISKELSKSTRQKSPSELGMDFRPRRVVRKNTHRRGRRGDRSRYQAVPSRDGSRPTTSRQVSAHPPCPDRGQLRRFDRSLRESQREAWNHPDHRWPCVLSGTADYRHDPRVVGKMAGHVVLPWVHRVFALLKRWSLGTYHGLRRRHLNTYLNEFVFRYNRRFHRHVSFETLLGLAAQHEPASYWDIVNRDNPRKGVPTIRRTARCRKTATGMRQDSASLAPPDGQIQPTESIQALHIDEPGTTG